VIWYTILIVCVLVADQLTKWLITDAFQLFESREIIPGLFNLVYVTNTGAAFSLFADVDSPWRHYFFLGVGLVALVGLTVACSKFKVTNPLYVWPLGLIAGGAAGNLVDRICHGAVIDFLDFYFGSYHWPAFNVADSAICVGAGFFIVLNILDSKKQNLSE
jgi:signal peptidase II